MLTLKSPDQYGLNLVESLGPFTFNSLYSSVDIMFQIKVLLSTPILLAILIISSEALKISDVFAAMIENPRTSESQQGFVIIENVRAEFIKQFKEIVCNGNVTKKDLNVELLMFADRYNIQPLVKLSKSQIKKTISRENLIDVIKASDALNDDQLLKAAVDFVSENKGSFENDSELMEMMRSNPECFAKMWGMLMFKNE